MSTKSLSTFVIFARHEYSTRCAKSFSFTYGFSLCGALLMVSETRPTSKMSVTLVAGDANVGECARRDRHTIAASLVTDMCYITPTAFMTCITYLLFSHWACKVSYHVTVSFDIVVE